MADWPILGWQVHLVDDTLHHGLRADRRGARCRTSAGDTGRCGISRPRPAILLPEWAARQYGSIAFEARITELAWLQNTSSPSLSSAVTERSTGGHTASLRTSSLAQRQARDLHPRFEPPGRLRPRRVTFRGGIHLHRRRSNLHLRSVSVTSLTDRFFYQRRYLAPLDIALGCLQVARHPLCLGQGNFPRASARGCGGIPSQPPVLVLRTRSFLLPFEPRYAVRVATFLERRIQPPTRHPTSPHRLLAKNFPSLGTYFARNKCDQPACLAGQDLLFALNQMVSGDAASRPGVLLAVEHPRCLFGVKNSDTLSLVAGSRTITRLFNEQIRFASAYHRFMAFPGHRVPELSEVDDGCRARHSGRTRSPSPECGQRAGWSVPRRSRPANAAAGQQAVQRRTGHAFFYAFVDELVTTIRRSSRGSRRSFFGAAPPQLPTRARRWFAGRAVWDRSSMPSRPLQRRMVSSMTPSCRQNRH